MSTVDEALRFSPDVRVGNEGLTDLGAVLVLALVFSARAARRGSMDSDSFENITRKQRHNGKQLTEVFP